MSLAKTSSRFLASPGKSPAVPADANAPANPDWWRGAVIYQVYPRSFMDANGDGVGDLPGIIEKIPYIARLGVDAIWVSPFFVSPMFDAGYDVADYRDVDPIFGTLSDFDDLLEHAHRHGLRVIIDLVLSHTSHLHPWFKESSGSRDNPKADWYTWSDPKPDGTPPNNWLSHFGGVSWTWSARRRQYYFHNFLAEQPDLNYHNPEVQAAILDVARFWLERGVDGFRLDTANMYFQDKNLRDNPPCPRDKIENDFETYEYQIHLHDKSQPENLVFHEDLRRLVDSYGGRTLLGELGVDSESAGQILADYTKAGKRLNMAYVFALMLCEFDATKIRELVFRLDREIADGWMCWSLSNHDVVRVLSRWGLSECGRQAAPMLHAFLLSLRGSICIYQGDELGLTEADIAFDQVQDPHGRAMWPEFKGRDGCRTPMVWNRDLPNGGFSDEKPWLPVPPEHLGRAVDVQEGDASGVLEQVRAFLAWRRRHPVLMRGSMTLPVMPGAGRDLLFLSRRDGDEEILAVFNFAQEPETFPLPPGFTRVDIPGFIAGNAPLPAVPEDDEGPGDGGAGGSIEVNGMGALFFRK